jgi:hypothetical protein
MRFNHYSQQQLLLLSLVTFANCFALKLLNDPLHLREQRLATTFAHMRSALDFSEQLAHRQLRLTTSAPSMMPPHWEEVVDIGAEMRKILTSSDMETDLRTILMAFSGAKYRQQQLQRKMKLNHEPNVFNNYLR